MKKQKIRLWLFAALSAGIVCFAFGNSLMSREASSAESGRLLLWLQSVLGPGNGDPELLHKLIRKAAHVIEFAALGVSVGGFSVNLGYLQGRRHIALPLLITLLVAVCDEFLQSFSGRASMVSDVILDYAGALAGLGFVWIDIFLKKKCRGE